MLEKYGKGGAFYHCPTDELYYYADKNEANIINYVLNVINIFALFVIVLTI